MKIQQYPIWKKHEKCLGEGSWRIKKVGNGYDVPYDFSCDGCSKNMSIFDVGEQTKIKKEIKKKKW